jgi:hypothetical protein
VNFEAIAGITGWIICGITASISYRRMSRVVGMRPSYGFSALVLVLPGWWLVWFLMSYLPQSRRHRQAQAREMERSQWAARERAR